MVEHHYTNRFVNGFNVCFIEDNEWLQYTFELNDVQQFDVDIRFASDAAGGELYLENEFGKISKTVTIPSSGGKNTSGVSIREARQFIRFSGNYPNIASFHLCEGNAFNLTADSSQIGNLVSIMVLDFIKSRT